jgi:hypothetical protein
MGHGMQAWERFMNRILLVVWTTLVSCCVSSGQTNASTAAFKCPPCLAPNLPTEPAQKSPAISLQPIANSLSELSPLARFETRSEVVHAMGPSDDRWETAAHAYQLEDFCSPGRDGDGAPPANVCSQTRLLALQGHVSSPPETKGLKLPTSAEDVIDPSLRDSFAVSNQKILKANLTETALYSRMKSENFFKPSGPEYDTDLERKIDAAFSPEIIRMGHVRIQCSIITAIARKNPLCLLNPNFLGISF